MMATIDHSETVATLQYAGAGTDAIRVTEAILRMIDPSGSASLRLGDLVRLTSLSSGRCYAGLVEVIKSEAIVAERRRGLSIFRVAAHG